MTYPVRSAVFCRLASLSKSKTLSGSNSSKALIALIASLIFSTNAPGSECTGCAGSSGAWLVFSTWVSIDSEMCLAESHLLADAFRGLLDSPAR